MCLLKGYLERHAPHHAPTVIHTRPLTITSRTTCHAAPVQHTAQAVLTDEVMEYCVLSITVRNVIVGIDNSQFGGILKWMFIEAQHKQNTTERLKKNAIYRTKYTRCRDKQLPDVRKSKTIMMTHTRMLVIPKYLTVHLWDNSNTYPAFQEFCTWASYFWPSVTRTRM